MEQGIQFHNFIALILNDFSQVLVLGVGILKEEEDSTVRERSDRLISELSFGKNGTKNESLFVVKIL